MRQQSKRHIGVFDLVNSLILISLALITLYPLYYVFIVSISSGGAVARGEVTIFPMEVTFSSYRTVLKDPNLIRSFFNTVRYTIFGTAINLIFSTLCAYPLAIKTFSGRKLFTGIIVFTMFFSGGLIPTYLVVKSLGMLNSIWALVLPTAISTWNMIIIRTFFQNIPDSLRESAFIDGANDLHIFIRIMLPLSLPVMTTMTLFYATSHWNSFFQALIYMQDKELFPMQLILRNMLISGEMSEQYSDILQDSNIVPTTLQYATIIVSTLPILLVYPFVQKYFVKGVMVGSLKG